VNVKASDSLDTILEAIKWSMANDIKNFDMGICCPQDNDLWLFKSRWGTIEHKLHDYFMMTKEVRAPSERRASMTYKLARLAWRRIVPSFVASAIGLRLLCSFE
jgi:hypothetical protein